MFEHQAVAKRRRQRAPSVSESIAPGILSWESTSAQPMQAAIPQRPGAKFDIGDISIFPPAAQVGPDGGSLSPDLTGRIQGQQGGGSPLEPSVQRKMEAGFGHNFADVRIFADDAAARQAQALSASAFTVGTNIFFNAQTYEPSRPDGQHLLAHELTHVVQRGRYGSPSGAQSVKTVSSPADASEREAVAVADHVVAGKMVDVVASPSAVASRSVFGWLEDKAEDVGGFLYDDMKAKAHLVKEGVDAAGNGISWAEDKEKESTAWLDDKAQGIPGLEQLADVGKSLADTQTEFAGGAERSGVGLVGGVAGAAADPVDAMRGLQSLGEHLPMIPGIPNPIKAWNDLIKVAAGTKSWDEFRTSLTPGASIEENTRFWKQFAGAFLGQYSEQWKQGRYADVAGHVVGDIISQFFGGEFADAGEVTELTKTVEAVETTEVVAETTKPVEAVNATKMGEGRPGLRTPEQEDPTLIDFDPLEEEPTRVNWEPPTDEAEQTRVDWEPPTEDDPTRVDLAPPAEEEPTTGEQYGPVWQNGGEWSGPIWRPEEVLELPEGSAIMVDSPAEGRNLYSRSIREDSLREVAIYRNTRTGQVVVGQGNRGSVAIDPQVWEEALPGPPGTWELEAHYHPIAAETGITRVPQRFPTSTNGDFSGLEWESRHSGNQARTSRIDIIIEGDKRSYTEFSYDPNAEYPYKINYPDPVTGERTPAPPFKSRVAYEEWYSDQFPGWRAGIEESSSAAAVQPAAHGPDVFEEISRELTFDPAMVEEAPADVGSTATAARDAGFTGPRGAPGTVDLATQSHAAASDVRAEYGVSGADVQSAHIGPTSFLRDVEGYSRSRADTVLLDRDIHAEFDGYWKEWAMAQRRAGRAQVLVSELHAVMLDAIERIPGLPQRMRDAMAWRLDLELFRDLGLQPAHEVTLPYPNIKPAP